MLTLSKTFQNRNHTYNASQVNKCIIDVVYSFM
jgi:hypothetical protein